MLGTGIHKGASSGDEPTWAYQSAVTTLQQTRGTQVRGLRVLTRSLSSNYKPWLMGKSFPVRSAGNIAKATCFTSALGLREPSLLFHFPGPGPVGSVL